MPMPKKSAGSIRRYGYAELTRLRFIKTAQGLGFTLDEIGDLVKLDDGTHCKEAHDIAAQKARHRARAAARPEVHREVIGASCAPVRNSF